MRQTETNEFAINYAFDALTLNACCLHSPSLLSCPSKSNARQQVVSKVKKLLKVDIKRRTEVVEGRIEAGKRSTNCLPTKQGPEETNLMFTGVVH